MSADNIYRALSYDSLSSEHREQLAKLYTEIGMVYRAAGISALEKIAALQAAWFRNDVGALASAKKDADGAP